MTPQDEVGNLKDTELQLIGRLIVETQKKVDDLAIGVSRRNATIAAVEVNLHSALKYKEKCEKEISECAEWRAEHNGVYEGKRRFIMMLSTVIGIVIACTTLWFTTIKPTLDRSIGFIEKASKIEKKFENLN